MGDYNNGDLYILDIKAGELQKMNIDKLLGGRVCFSPEGTKICYSASIREKDYYNTHIQDSTLEIYDINSGELIHPLTDFDSTVIPLRWTAKGILIRWQNKTNYLIGLLSQDGNVEMLSEKVDSFIMEASITRDGNHISYNKATSNENFEVYLDDEKITNENSVFNGKLKSNREIISWKSSDEISKRSISPTELFYDNGGWYLTGFCHKRNEKRTFRLDRIKEIELLKQENIYMGKNVYSSSDKFQEREYLLEINTSLYKLIKDNFYMKHCYVISDNEPMKIKIVSKYEEDITSMVLRNPKSVKVIGPEVYRLYLKNIIQELSNKYI